MTVLPQPTPEVSLACEMTAIPAEQRAAHEALTGQLFSEAVLEVQELGDGYRFRLAASDYHLVTAFITNERLCCPFFRFTLDVAPRAGPLWLTIGGSEEVKAFLKMELGVD
jgi:hypothetical protein